MKLSFGFFCFCSFLSFLIFPSKVFAADVVINEVSPASNPEWVELYNTNTNPISLQGYSIDFGSSSQVKSFCEGDQIAGNSYKLIILATSAFWLHNTNGDTVNLKNNSDTV